MVLCYAHRFDGGGNGGSRKVKLELKWFNVNIKDFIGFIPQRSNSMAQRNKYNI